MGKPAAPQGIVDSAKVALSKWQKRREDEWSVEWCSLAAGVELVFENEDDEE